MDKFENILKKMKDSINPDLLKQDLITASIFIAVFENFKSTIIENVKYFYCDGIENGKEIFNDYEEKVLSKVTSKENRQIKATLLWYKENRVISELECVNFKNMTDLRNTLGHDLLNKMFEGLPKNIYDIYFDMIVLFKKIIKWWIVEIEMPTSHDITEEQFDEIEWDKVTSVNLEYIKIMTGIVFAGNEDYLNMLKRR